MGAAGFGARRPRRCLGAKRSRSSCWAPPALPPDLNVEVVEVNGQPAAILRTDKQAVLLIALEIDQVQVREIRVIGNLGKLRGL